MKPITHTLAALALCLGTTAAHAADIALRIGDIVAPTSVQAQATDRFAEIVNGADAGIEVQVFHGSSLGDGAVQVENVSFGVQEMFIGGLSFLGAYSERLNIAETPFTFASREHFEGWVNSAAFDEIMDEMIASSNQRIINREVLWRRGPFRVMLANKPVLTLDDLSSTKLRLWDAEVANRFWGEKGLGAIPVNIAFGDVYVALRQGVVDAVTTPFDLVDAMKFAEVAKHLMYVDSFWQMLPMTINEDTWNALTDEQKELLTAAANEAGEYFNTQVEASVAEWTKGLEEMGVEFHQIDRGPWVERIAERNLEWAAEGYWPEGLIEDIEALKQ